MRTFAFKNWIYPAGFLALTAMAIIWAGSALDGKETLQWIWENAVRPPARAMKSVFTNPFTYFALAAILLIERSMPAKRNQKIFSVGFAQDTAWFFLDIAAQATVIAALAVYWQTLYKEHFSFLTIRAIEEFPFWLRVVIAVLVADFSGWLHHYIRHKVWWMWPFHAVHHSQKELNLFTAVRYHLMEYMLTAIIYVFFFGVFTMNPHTVIYYTLFYNWYTKLTHANIKSDFGILRYVLVTPQSHRIHHSFLPEHRDKNLGIIFSFWDFMFGTQYRKYDEYPDSGIADETFPHEMDGNLISLLVMLVKQHLYPFKAIANIMKQKDMAGAGAPVPPQFGVIMEDVIAQPKINNRIKTALAPESDNRLLKYEAGRDAPVFGFAAMKEAAMPQKSEFINHN